MTPEAIEAVVPVLRLALEYLTRDGAKVGVEPWSVTAKFETEASRWDVKLDREGHLTVQRQS